MRRLRRKSPVALALTGATGWCDWVARRRRHAPHPGKTPGGASAYRGCRIMRLGSPDKAQCAASGKIPGSASAYRGYSMVQRLEL
ncbi:hypothetical protein B9037_003875 [Klebsiella aerogenes]|nr:hypothetical protein B9037_003875 [Klebsiella aerogenes]